MASLKSKTPEKIWRFFNYGNIDKVLFLKNTPSCLKLVVRYLVGEYHRDSRQKPAGMTM